MSCWWNISHLAFLCAFLEETLNIPDSNIRSPNIGPTSVLLSVLAQPTPADTSRNNDVVITSKRRHFDVITSKWRRFDVITTLLLSHVFSGTLLSVYIYQPFDIIPWHWKLVDCRDSLSRRARISTFSNRWVSVRKTYFQCLSNRITSFLH